MYRLDAETFAPATSTIDDYINSGVLVGDTVGQAMIETFVDTAPALTSPPLDEYTYVIQPLFRCDGPTCTGPVPAEFGGSESAPGKANLSTDNLISDGQTTVAGTVKVSVPLLASFTSFGATRVGNTNIIEWMTAAEIDTIGYNVYRGSSRDEASMVRINANRVRAEGPGFGYRLEDQGAAAGNVFYQIREVASNGIPSRTDVFTVQASGGRGTSGGRSRNSVKGRSGIRSDGSSSNRRNR